MEVVLLVALKKDNVDVNLMTTVDLLIYYH